MVCKARALGKPCYEIDREGRCHPEKHGCDKQEIIIFYPSKRLSNNP